MKFSGLPIIIEGQILSVQKRLPGDQNIIRYTCLADMPDGDPIILTNVIEASLFGGISDYYRRRARSTADAESDFSNQSPSYNDATVGERVYISFVNGNPLSPVILGYKQHPNQSSEVDGDALDRQPNFVWQFQGVRQTVDDTGQFKIFHKGAPEVSFEPGSGFPSLPVSAPGSIPGDDNPAITPISDDNLSAFEMLDKGIVRIRDYSGNLFETDPESGKITITNNKELPFEDLNPGLQIPEIPSLSSGIQAESIIIDSNEESMTLSSRGLFKIETDSEMEVIVDGPFSSEVSDNLSLKIGGDYELTSDGAGVFSFQKNVSISASGQSGLTLNNGKVAIGSSQAELLSLFNDTLTLINTLLTAIVNPANQPTGNLGFPTVVSTALTQEVETSIRTELLKIQEFLKSITGSL